MGLSLSRLISTWNEILMRKFFTLSDEIEASIARSISFGSRDGGEVIVRALSFKNREQLDEKLQKCERQMIKRLVPLQALVVSHNANDRISKLSPPVTEPVLFSSPRPIEELDSAATKVQKVYKSYRTRRNLADCAVVIRELWWKTLDSAALNQSSISFFNNNGQETAASRWTRARIKAAKVGKGLSKDEKAQMLALHHWLEAIDPRHRYGRNLHFYYDVWSDKKSYQPFFYWLDIGDGKEVNLSSCPRVELQQQCIQYLGPKERDIYEVIVDEGKLMYKQSGMFLDTDEKSKWIFVLSASRSLYVGRKIKGVFQHSSFLSGGVTSSAGRLTATTGVLEAIWPYSGHYLPTDDNFKAFISFLEEHHVDMTNVKRCSIDDDSPPLKAKNKGSFKASTNIDPSMITSDLAAFKELVADRIPQDVGGAINTVNINAPKLVLPKSTSFKWTSGVGPRIGCVRDYPIELQSQALEKVNLSPTLNPSPRYRKSDDPIPSPRPSSKLRFSPRVANMGLLSPRASQSIAN